LVLGRMRWMHCRRLVRVLVLSRSPLSVDIGLTNPWLAAARDGDDRLDRRGGRGDFLSNRCSSSITVTRSKPLNQLTLRTSSGQTGLPSKGGPAIAHRASLHGVCRESGF